MVFNKKIVVAACAAEMFGLASLPLLIGSLRTSWPYLFALGVLLAVVAVAGIAVTCRLVVKSWRGADEDTFPGPKVIGWCKYDDGFIDWFGGSRTESETADAEESIVREIRRRGYEFGGHYHQYGEFGCPVMDDGSVYMVSMRSWGEIMSRAWGGDYCKYAWEDAIGDVPTEAASPKRKTVEEMENERRAKEEAKSKAKEEWARQEEERARKKAEEDEENKKAMKRYMTYLRRRFTGDAAGLVKFLSKELPEIMGRCLDDRHGKDFKWVLFSSTRRRVEAEESRARRNALAKLAAAARKDNADFAAPKEEN